jgi:hypothetical protein
MKNPSKERADEVKSLLLPGPGSTRIRDATPLAVSALKFHLPSVASVECSARPLHNFGIQNSAGAIIIVLTMG